MLRYGTDSIGSVVLPNFGVPEVVNSLLTEGVPGDAVIGGEVGLSLCK
jgi:hypothetical protein